MRTITPDPISLTTHHLHLCFRETDAVLSSATGFIYERNAERYLVTNWHNVTGRNPGTGEYLSKNTAAMPDMVSTMFRVKEQPGSCLREHIPLYHDSRMAEPVWYEHPQHGKAVDVVAIPLSDELRTRYQFFPINVLDFNSEFKEVVADEAFVIGYPFSETPYLQLPIWKRASIASEPDVDIDQLPKLLIDTATRPGLSGSPVVMQRIGLHGASGGVLIGSEIIGQIRNFIGVYSGRVGENEFKVQLGIVWKARVIDEIIDAKVSGNAS
jgi:hypothetical protein